MNPLPRSTSVTITNPLVLYRTLVATNRIEPDPAQHRLAIHLQKVYYRLKDYRPDTEIQRKLDRIKRLGTVRSATDDNGRVRQSIADSRSGLLPRWRGQAQENVVTALTRRLTDYQAAAELDSPQGLLVHGQVGTGKSILIDLLADSLPNAFKARWHFSTFMLQVFARLEDLRRSYAVTATEIKYETDEYFLLKLAREMVCDSPVLFIDEFQFPDRASSKLLSHLFTSFFHLGGVLIATSNRMPDDLANAAGIDFSAPNNNGIVKRSLHMLGWVSGQSDDHGVKAGGDFDDFLKVLKARCEIWEMEGERDWRRRDSLHTTSEDEGIRDTSQPTVQSHRSELEQKPTLADKTKSKRGTQVTAPSQWLVADERPDLQRLNREVDARASLFLKDDSDGTGANLLSWGTDHMKVYGREVIVLRQSRGFTKWMFEELCGVSFGPADYVSLASRYHTFIIIGVPCLGAERKDEARRFITFLDAAYEARCRILIAAAANPDDIFFPRSTAVDVDTTDATDEGDAGSDPNASIYSETFSEIYQDQTSPFRPNTSAYVSSASPPSYATSSLPTSGSQLSAVRSVLSDEDSDFGPVSGQSRLSMPHLPQRQVGLGHSVKPDFRRAGAFVGQDERFAYKRAESRLWEMCGDSWWRRKGEWWRPLTQQNRHWERPASVSNSSTAQDMTSSDYHKQSQGKFQDNGSPFRTTDDPPPRFGSMHAWGLGLWGKRAGVWGRGADAVAERKTRGG